MQIQWREDVVSNCAGTVRQSTADDTGRGKGDVSAILSRREGSRKWKDEFCRTARHREIVRAETRKGFVMWIVVSCSNGDRGRWGAELDLGSRESFDDLHRSTTLASCWAGGSCAEPSK